MKNLLILTSVLAVAACGGGSGGDGGIPRPAFVPQSSIDSNKELTDMVSQVLVATDGTTLTRSGTTNYNGKEYRVYDLNDVVLKTPAFADDFTRVNKMATLTFSVENGEIKGIFIDEPQAWGTDGIRLERDNNNKFAGNGVFGGELEVTLSDAEYESIARASEDGAALTRDSMGLRYSDFGVLRAHTQFDDNGTPVDEIAELYFAGGYNIGEKQIDMHEKPGASVILNGRAVGEVNLGYESADGSISLYTNDAELEFVDGKTNVSLPFFIVGDDGSVTDKQWYTVNATINSIFNENNPNTNVTSLTFTDGDNIDDAYAAYRFSSGNEYEAQPNIVVEPGGSGAVIRDGFINYYGDNDTPTEAVGNMRYMEEHSNIINNRIGFETAFGFGGSSEP